MTSKKMFYVMSGILGLLGLLIIVMVIVGDRLLQQQSNKLLQHKLDSSIIENQQGALIQAKSDTEKYAELEKIAKQIVPQDKDQAKATREILNIASKNGVKIASVSFPASTLGSKPQATKEEGGQAAAAPTSSITQVKPVEGIKDLLQLDIIVTSDNSAPASYQQFIAFLNELEQNRRTSQVSQISIQPDSSNRALLNFNLTITVYVKP